MGKSKKRILVSATPEGIEMAERALIRFGFGSKSNFAQTTLISRGTVTKFFDGKPIQLDTLQRICDKLTLDWRVIAGCQATNSSSSSMVQQQTDGDSNLELIEEKKQVSSSTRRVTVIDPQSKRVKAVITLEGDPDCVLNLALLEAILREYSGDWVKIIDLREGCIKVFIEGYPEEINRLISRINSGKLKQLDHLKIREIQALDESSFEEETTQASDKWTLIEDIVNRRLKSRKLSGVDLSDAYLSHADLSHANLSHADLSHADLSDAYLIGAYLIGADLSRADLSGADLSGADLSRADLSRANLSRANLIGANLIGANLRGANLIGADLSGANLSGANLRDSDLSGANLSGANLRGANLRDSDLRYADLRGTKIDEKTQLAPKWLLVWKIVNQENTNRDLSGVDLSFAFLQDANLSDCRLVRANLVGANLENANLARTNLIGADLSQARLLKANLTYADLSGATVKDAQFGENLGISARLKQELIDREAIFIEPPGDRSPVLI